jgi:hypothetical protein
MSLFHKEMVTYSPEGSSQISEPTLFPKFINKKNSNLVIDTTLED